MRNATQAGLMLPLVIALAGCFSLARESPTLEQYVLGGAPPVAAQPAAPTAEADAALAGLNVGIRRLNLASYLATPAIIVRRGTHQIVQSDFHRWGEELGAGISRTVAAHVAGTPVGAVDVAPWPVRARYDYVLHLQVSAFEGTIADGAATGSAHMLTLWEISRQLDGVQLARGVTDYRAPGWRPGDYAALVSMLDRGLEGLARDIRRCLALLAAESPQPDGSTPRSDAVLTCPSAAAP
jgi:uncharacterized lipoprotein YmbA